MALYGIYGSHTTEACPWNNIETAKRLNGLDDGALESVAKEHGIREIIGQYHSALEHTFLWVVDAEDPHQVQAFCVAAGVAAFNKLTIVPLITFREGVIPGLKRIHSL
ncbi:MAG: hypothetical protein O7F76_14305 [Planctomycetota bacterium]|nr:hypothetical protein [Planctomycetota bacterium]